MATAIKDFEGLPVSLKVGHVAEILGISRKVAYDLTRQKGFPAIRVGKRIVVPRDKFLLWYDRKAEEPFE